MLIKFISFLAELVLKLSHLTFVFIFYSFDFLIKVGLFQICLFLEYLDFFLQLEHFVAGFFRSYSVTLFFLLFLFIRDTNRFYFCLSILEVLIVLQHQLSLVTDKLVYL